jgi:hypothetical protein
MSRPESLSFIRCRGAWSARRARNIRRPVLVQLAMTLPAGGLERYCRYAQTIDAAKLPTFLNTRYASEPRGLRVGPWPGWRGIPELPIVKLHTGHEVVTGKYYFLGDEELAGELRVMFPCQQGLGLRLRFETEDASLRPLSAQVGGNLPAWAPPQAVSLRPELSGQHPRLVLDAAGLLQLRQELRGSKTPHWRRLRKLVRDSWELPYETTPEGKVLPGRERLTGADRMLIAAAMAQLQPTAKTIAWAKRTYFAYLRETTRPDFGPLGIDTQSGEVLYLLCVGYDWLHGAMIPRERTRAQKRLWEIAEICRRHLDPARRDYAQAHYLGCGLGMLAFAFLFWEEHPAAKAWAAELRGAFARVLAMLPADGFFPHGLNLWIYEHGFLHRWLELFRQCAGEDLWKETPYFAAASRFRAAATSPDEQCGVTFGDPQYRVTGDSWCHLLTANRLNDASAQALGERLLNQHPEDTDHRHAPPRRRVYELLWHQPKLPAKPLGDGLSTFADGGQSFVRRGQTLVTLRSGAPLGRQRRAAGEVGGYGHSDPCNGALLVWRGGTFVGSGPGPLYRRDTALHNLVTIDGRGQIGDSCVWYPDLLEERFIPPAPVVSRRGDTVRIICELAAAYLPQLGVRRYTRVIVIASDGSLRGEDEIELDAKAEIAWHWHTRAKVTSAGGDLILRGPGCRARLAVEPEPGSLQREQPECFVAAYPHEGTVGTEITVTRFSAKTVFRWELK